MILRLIIYDIEDDRYRTKLADVLEAKGLVRLQKSVFAGRHPQHQWKKIWATIQDLHKKRGGEQDKVYSMIVSRQMYKAMHFLGIPPPIEDVAEDKLMMWI